jgi:heme/copper-type cytochrome/quinol oxidase subunit 2
MQLVILGMCSVVGAGVFAAMFLAIWSTRRATPSSSAFGQSFASELVWAAIPCLMLLAAAIPMVMAIAQARSGH